MNTVTIFRGTLPKNFLGNVIYQFQLPCSCTALHIRLICHLQDRKEAAFLHEKEAEAAFLDHCGRLPDAQEKERLLAQMKTEIQLAAFLSGKFLGNVHRPGNIKEMHFSPDEERTCGCMDQKGPYHGLLKLAINSFGVLEEEISYELRIECIPETFERGEQKMLKRIELHNHSLESDGRMSVDELASWLISNGISAFSLTDHNTVSGFPLLREYWEKNPVFEYLTGYELTSWYGHILCQDIREYIPWDDLDRENGDLFLDRVHAQGGLAGMAHPKSFPHPVSNGLNFEFCIHDWTKVDFIEIINNSHPAYPDNAEGIRYWEEALLQGSGAGIAPVSGMDLHAPVDMSRYYRTWMELDCQLETAPLSEQLTYAVKKNRTIVSNGPVLLCERDGDSLSLHIDLKTDERVRNLPADTPFLLSLRSPSASFCRRLQGRARLSLSSCGIRTEEPIVLKLYPGNALPVENALPVCIRASVLPGKSQSIR